MPGPGSGGGPLPCRGQFGSTLYAGFFVAKEPGAATITFMGADSCDGVVKGGSITCAVTVVE